MRHFPAFLDLTDRSSLLVGGGERAVRKLRLLLKAGARVTVVAPQATAEIAALAAEGALVWTRRGFDPRDVQGRALVIAASDSAAVDGAVSRAAQARQVPVNVVDNPALSSFIVPALVDRDPLVIGISSGGAAPVLARRLRAQLEALLPAGLGRLARFAGAFRSAVEATLPAGPARRRFWETFFAGPLAEQVLAGEETRSREQMLSLINGGKAPAAGIVHIVGAGPGDPELLSLKALRLLQEADVVIYDKLVGPEILDYARRDAERLYVGKAKANHSKSQDEINGLMAAQARQGKRVVRLKGGDPYVFGRGGEERNFLEAQGVTVEVVPGITAAVGCAAAAGIPLISRGTAQAVTFRPGHARSGGEPHLDWRQLAQLNQTLAIYMGVSTAGVIARRLIENGLSPTTPAAIVENGTLADQKTVAGRLCELETLVAAARIAGPALIIVGEVVQLGKVSADALPHAIAV